MWCFSLFIHSHLVIGLCVCFTYRSPLAFQENLAAGTGEERKYCCGQFSYSGDLTFLFFFSISFSLWGGGGLWKSRVCVCMGVGVGVGGIEEDFCTEKRNDFVLSSYR